MQTSWLEEICGSVFMVDSCSNWTGLLTSWSSSSSSSGAAAALRFFSFWCRKQGSEGVIVRRHLQPKQGYQQSLMEDL